MKLASLVLALTLCTPAWAGQPLDFGSHPLCDQYPPCTTGGTTPRQETGPQPDMSKLDVHVEHTTHGIAIVMDGSEVCPKGWMWTRHVTGNSDKEGFPIVVDSCTKAK